MRCLVVTYIYLHNTDKCNEQDSCSGSTFSEKCRLVRGIKALLYDPLRAVT